MERKPQLCPKLRYACETMPPVAAEILNSSPDGRTLITLTPRKISALDIVPAAYCSATGLTVGERLEGNERIIRIKRVETCPLKELTTLGCILKSAR